jgi:predicted ATPase
MIKKIEINNFKSILNANLEIGNLNVFSGINGSGKSTFLQSLLLLRQSYNSGYLTKSPISLLLGNNNTLISLGTFKDLLCQQASRNDERVVINIDFKDENLIFTSENYSSENRDLNILKGEINKSIIRFENESLFNDRCQYLAAERIQPTEDYPRFQSNELLGKQGEYTAHYIEKHANEDINIKEFNVNKNSNSTTLINQINYWLGEISDSIEVLVKENLNTNRIELSYRYKLDDGTPTQNQKPQNVGFGITHTLPIIVAILAAKPNDIIIIENPETHLHPKGQSKLSHLFAIAAQNNVQLFIETHSDHIINGLRVAVKKKIIDKNDVFLYYFTKTIKNLSNISRIQVQSAGGLDNWPEGFFDEWDNQLNELL